MGGISQSNTTMTGIEEETYLVALTSDCLAWKRDEHKRLMREVLKKLPWQERVGCHMEDGRFMVAYSSNIQHGFEPFEVMPRGWLECPVPEKGGLRRRRLLRMKKPTSYLGTRIKPPKKDSTSLLFRVHSKSGAVTYSGIWAKADLTMNVAGISVIPPSIQVKPVGPNGRTGDYSFKIASDNAPPGTYNLTIYLYSKDNRLIVQQTVELIVAA